MLETSTVRYTGLTADFSSETRPTDLTIVSRRIFREHVSGHVVISETSRDAHIRPFRAPPPPCADVLAIMTKTDGISTSVVTSCRRPLQRRVASSAFPTFALLTSDTRRRRRRCRDICILIARRHAQDIAVSREKGLTDNQRAPDAMAL